MAILDLSRQQNYVGGSSRVALLELPLAWHFTGIYCAALCTLCGAVL
jgi:hypothetical protein